MTAFDIMIKMPVSFHVALLQVITAPSHCLVSTQSMVATNGRC